VCYPGLPPIPDYTLSTQGIEKIFATNHVGHFVLTITLLPLLQRTANEYGNARIIVTTSSFHLLCRKLDLRLLTSPVRTNQFIAFDSCWRYGRSKLANILFTRELARRLGKKGANNVYANCFHPGNISTEAMDTWRSIFGSVVGSFIKRIFQFIGQTATEGAATAMYLAASPQIENLNQSGKYFIPIATEGETSILAEDEDLAKDLWSWTEQQVVAALGSSLEV
jgi:NAD(P)-dependent dehydrogenase (short-subunit alcohol dehydrogenase family)